MYNVLDYELTFLFLDPVLG